MKKKLVLTLNLIIIFPVFLLACSVNNIKNVESIPPGFVLLSTAGNNLNDGGLHYTIGESQITFLDQDNNTLYQNTLTNSDFIVSYRNEFYINETEYSELVNRATSVKVVSAAPEGFILLNAALNKLENGLHCVFGETQILFLDADDICIYQTKLNNNDFIVLYDNKYYINEKELAVLIDKANVIAAQRNNIYKRGETIYLRGFGSNSYVVLLHQEYIETDSNGKTLCHLTFGKSFDGSLLIAFEYDLLTQIFDYIETDKGTIIDKFIVDNIDILVEIPAGEEIRFVAVKSPDYPGCSRKIGNEYFPAKNEVQTKPEGFIKLDEALEKLDNGMRYILFETQMSFVVGQHGIYSANVEDSSFLVIYENEFYIKEKQFLEIVKMANVFIKQNGS